MRRWVLAPCMLSGALMGGVLVKKVWLEKFRRQKSEVNAANCESDLLYTWLLLGQKGIQADEYFISHGFHSVAVLGMNRIGRRFFDALQGSEEVCAAYGVEIDNPAAVHETLTVYRLGDDTLPSADCMVICDLKNVPEKLKAAQKEFSSEIVTLEQVLLWLLERHKIKPWDGAVRGWPSSG